MPDNLIDALREKPIQKSTPELSQSIIQRAPVESAIEADQTQFPDARYTVGVYPQQV